MRITYFGEIDSSKLSVVQIVNSMLFSSSNYDDLDEYHSEQSYKAGEKVVYTGDDGITRVYTAKHDIAADTEFSPDDWDSYNVVGAITDATKHINNLMVCSAIGI